MVGAPDADRFSTHRIRRVAATAILNSGSTLSGTMRTDGSNSSSFRPYLDLHQSGELSTRAVFTVEQPASSDGAPSSTYSATSSPKLQKIRAGTGTHIPARWG